MYDFFSHAAFNPQAPVPFYQTIIFAMITGYKIPAIKMARQAFNLGLKEAKDLVEEIEPQVKSMPAGEAFEKGWELFEPVIKAQDKRLIASLRHELGELRHRNQELNASYLRAHNRLQEELSFNEDLKRQIREYHENPSLVVAIAAE